MLLCVANAVAQGEWKPPLELRTLPGGDVELRFELGRWRMDQWRGGLVSVEADGLSSDNGVAGSPALPTASTLVRVPLGATVSVVGVETDGVGFFPLAGVRPIQPARVKDVDGDTIGEVTVASDTGALSVQWLGIAGNEAWVRLTVRPFSWDGSRLGVARRIKARLHVAGSKSPARRSEGYVIVSRPEFRNGLQPFVRWKRQSGYDVTEIYADTHLRDSVKALLAPLFDVGASVWPEFLLLVGDAAQLQSWPGTTRPQGVELHATDLYYAEYTGDYLPDVKLGRWPVNDSAELARVVEKTLAYEQGRLADTGYLRRLLLVAGNESRSPAPVTTNGQVNYLGQRLAGPDADTLVYRNPASGSQHAAILGDISSGVGLVNYTAHCSESGWTSPAVGFSAVDTLESRFPTVYINNCCKSNNFTGTCFGEQLLRKASGGAVAVVGATNSTLWNEDYYWAVGAKYPFSLQPAVDSLLPGALEQLGTGRHTTMGDLLWDGNRAVTQFGSPYDKFYWEIYCLLGDPGLMPYVGAPEAMSLSVQPVAEGDAVVRGSARPGARVAVMQGDSLLGCGEAEADGSVEVVLREVLHAGPLLLTATAYGCLPVVDTLTVGGGAEVLVEQVSLDDSTVSFHLHNVGLVPLDSLLVTLDCGDTLCKSLVTSLDVGGSESVAFVPYPQPRRHRYAARISVFDADSVLLSERDVEWKSGWRMAGVDYRMTTASGDTLARPVVGESVAVLAEARGCVDSVAVGIRLWPDTVLRAPLFVLDDDLEQVQVVATVYWRDTAACDTVWLLPRGFVENFDLGLGCLPWDRSPLRPWRSELQGAGEVCVRSSAIDYRQTSDMALDLCALADDSVAFRVKVSSEQNYDLLLFSVDDETVLSLSGSGGWTRRAFPLERGWHRLRWRYVKDESNNVGQDCAWVDDLELPPAVFLTPAGCEANALDIEAVDVPLRGFELVGNPSAGRITLATDGPQRLQVYDLWGRRVADVEVDGRAVLPLAPGVYVVSNGSLRRKAVVINQQ